MSRQIIWRFIDTGEMDGPSVMAIDEALLSCFDPDNSLPVLRLYGWRPAALSLGRYQNCAEVLDTARCAAAGVPVVRRITGGGVIFHADEITYSLVCAPHHLPSAASVKETYRVLTGFLLRFYRSIGLSPFYAADQSPGADQSRRIHFCFAGRESYDIVVGGKKLGGNAQRRLRRAIFQHGSIPLENRASEGALFLREAVSVAHEVTSLRQEQVTLTGEELRKLLVLSFQQEMGVVCERVPLTVQEQELAARLAAEKYSNLRWTAEGMSL